MDETVKSFTLEENYYDAFQFSDLSQSTIETENNGNFLNNIIDSYPPTIIIDPDSNISNIFMPSRSDDNHHHHHHHHNQSSSTPTHTIFNWDEQLKNNYNNNSDNDDQNFENEVKAVPIKSELNEMNATNAAAINSGAERKTVSVSVSKNSTTIQTQKVNSTTQNLNTKNIHRDNDRDNDHDHDHDHSNRDRPQIKYHKCESCPFLSISEENLSKHKNDINHTNTIIQNENKFKCPGCENIHYTSKSLEIHLEFDHKVLKNEIQIILESICKTKSNSAPINTNNEKEMNKTRIYLKNVEILKEPHYPSCYENDIANSSHTNDEDNGGGDDAGDDDNCNDEIQSISDDLICNLGDHDQTLDNNLTFIDLVGGCDSNSSSSKKFLSPHKQMQQQSNNKISIKSVDVLREPSLFHNHIESLQHQQHQYSTDYQQDNTNTIGNIGNNSPTIHSEKIYYDLDTGSMNNFQDNCVVESYSYQYQTIPNNETDLVNAADNNPIVNITGNQENQRPQRAKIYIKNVDILKEPIFVPSSNNLSNILNMNDDLRFNLLNNDTEHQRESSSTTYISPSILTSSSTISSAQQSLLPLPPISSSSSALSSSSSTILDNNSSQFLIKSNTDIHHHHYHRFHHHHLSVSHNRNSFVNNRRNKIYTRNADIINHSALSAISSSDFSNHFPKKIVTTSLHLRTVDELNLMNTNEVQNLITPILDQQNNENYDSNQQQEISGDCMQLHTNTTSDNSKNSDEIQINSTGTGDYNDYRKTEDNLPLTDDCHRHLNYENNLQNVWSSVEMNCQDTGLIADIDSNSSSLISNNDQNNLKPISTTTETSIPSIPVPILTPITLTSFELNTPQRPEFLGDYGEEINIDNEQNKRIVENENQCMEVEEIIEQEEEEEDIFIVCAREIVSQTTNHDKLSDQNNFNNIVTILGKEGNFHQLESVSASAALIDDEQQHDIVEIFDDLEKQQQNDLTTAFNNNGTENINNDLIPEIILNETNEQLNNKSRRGRPYGAKQTGITKLRKLYGNSISEAEFFKCDMNCALRFRKLETLNYHKKCHVSASSSSSSSSQEKHCPECKLNNFSSWNTLHTHLWRDHKIDMELYSCDVCNFKTPVQSKLVNIHKKIHLNEKNFKCDQCEKTFKNSKQLKNHRRLHRIQKNSQNHIKKSNPLSVNDDNMKNIKIHKCNECGSTYAHAKSLKNHVCKSNQFSCSVCNKLITSKSTYKLHILKHNNENLSIYRFKCDNCEYATNDHNSFRRHRMTHDQNPKYSCKFCDYKCIQSNLYQRHLLQKHLDVAHEVLFKCAVCSFTTINRANYKIHIAKHENNQPMVFVNNQPEQLQVQEQDEQQQIFNDCINLDNTENYTDENPINFNEINPSVQMQFADNLKNYQNDSMCNKIKVKSDLILTDPAKFYSSISAVISTNNVKNICEKEVI